jgi:hypothetical protein
VQYRVEFVNVAETAAAIPRLGENVYDAAEDALEQGGKWITYQARDLLRGQASGPYLPHYPRAITSETERSAGMVTMIVGPESAKPQGGMGLGVEYGSVNAPPLPHLNPAFDDRVESIIDRAARNMARWPGGGRP